MSRALVTLLFPGDRERACKWIMQAPVGTRVTFQATKRSLDQNAKMWAMLTDVATQHKWHGQAMKPGDWKFVFLDALKRELRVVPNLDGTGFVNLGRSSSDMSKEEMGQMIELMYAFGAEKGIKWRGPEEAVA